MATSGTIISVQEILETRPDLKLKLENKAKALMDEYPEDSELIQKAEEHIQAIFEYAESDINLDKLGTKKDLKNELEGIFKRVHGMVDECQEDILKDWDDLDDNGKEEVVKFWKAVGDFLSHALNWLRAMFNIVLEKIRQGMRVVSNAVKGLFNIIIGFFKKIF